MKSVFFSRKHLLPLVAIGLAAVGHASATPCATSVLSLTSEQIVTGQGSIGCEVTTTPPGLALYGNVSSAAAQPTNAPLLTELNNHAEATWSVFYSGAGPATTTISYDVRFYGSPSQSMTWLFDASTPGGTLPVAGGSFVLNLSGFSEFSGSETGPAIPGNYTFDVSASSGSPFNVTVPNGATIDIPNPTPNGVPEPASVATLAIGLAAGALVLGKRRKKK